MTDLRQAAMLALKALEATSSYDIPPTSQVRSSITALRTALEQQAEALQAMNDQLITGTSIMLDGKRVDPASVYKQAEPVAMRMPKVGDKVICLEDESFGEVVSLTAGGSPDISFDDGSRGTYMLREFAELFGYVAQPQRPWVGLTDEDFLEACQIAERGNYLLALQRIQIKLKEINNG